MDCTAFSEAIIRTTFIGREAIETEAIEIVSLTLDIPETELKAAPDGDAKKDVPYGIILGSDSKATTTRRD